MGPLIVGRHVETFPPCRVVGKKDSEDAAREAPETFEKILAKMLEKDDMLEEDTRLIADKMWQASRSNHTKKANLSKDREDLVAAFEKKQGILAIIRGKWKNT